MSKATRTKLQGIRTRLGEYMALRPSERRPTVIEFAGQPYVLADDLYFALQVIERYEMHEFCPCEGHAAAIQAIKAVPDAHARGSWWHDLLRLTGR